MAPDRPQDRPQTLPDPPGRRFFFRLGSIFLMFFGCFSAAGLSKRIVQKGTGDGGASPQGVLDNTPTSFRPPRGVEETPRVYIGSTHNEGMEN